MCCCRLIGQNGSDLSGVKRVYLEPFTVKGSSKEVKRALLTQLKKLSSIIVVSKVADADAILSGQAEVWVRGYRSLNPRSGRLPIDGTPVYNGFLSVELKDVRGETLWSYLVSPRSSENIAKELSKELDKHLAQALENR